MATDPFSVDSSFEDIFGDLAGGIDTLNTDLSNLDLGSLDPTELNALLSQLGIDIQGIGGTTADQISGAAENITGTNEQLQNILNTFQAGVGDATGDLSNLSDMFGATAAESGAATDAFKKQIEDLIARQRESSAGFISDIGDIRGDVSG
ncbi:hypothetical protein LCGC14_3063960, partial [marine sediment metagenome]